MKNMRKPVSTVNIKWPILISNEFMKEGMNGKERWVKL